MHMLYLFYKCKNILVRKICSNQNGIQAAEMLVLNICVNVIRTNQTLPSFQIKKAERDVIFLAIYLEKYYLINFQILLLVGVKNLVHC